MSHPWLNTETIDLPDVWQGPGACVGLLRAFMRAQGTFDVLFTLGQQTHKPGEWMILVEIGGEHFAIPPAMLLSFGRALQQSMKNAKRMGARDEQIAVIVEFAEVLVGNAEQALELSPHGLH